MQKFIRCIIFEKIEILILETKLEHLRRRKINHHHRLDLSNEVLTITRLVTQLQGEQKFIRCIIFEKIEILILETPWKKKNQSPSLSRSL